jgi:hypothetical protein
MDHFTFPRDQGACQLNHGIAHQHSGLSRNPSPQFNIRRHLYADLGLCE